MAEKQKDSLTMPPSGRPLYRVRPGTKFHRPTGKDGAMEVAPEGAEITLTEEQATSFVDLFEKV